MTAAQGEVRKEAWGTTQAGRPVELYTLCNDSLTVALTNYGARVVRILAPGPNGMVADVVLGCKDLAGYEAEKAFLGATVGRFGNRIAKGTFTLGGETFHVPANDRANALHGGAAGFDRKVWTARAIADGVEFTLVSPDGDMGFPGTLTACVRYTLREQSLHIDYSATTDRTTVVNLTNHCYFNLAGEASGSVLDQRITLHADRYTPIDAESIPLGPLAPVAGTPFDLRTSTAIGERIHADDVQLQHAGGYDHNFVLNGSGNDLRVAAEAVDPASGRTLTVSTTEPGVQFYSGNSLDGSIVGLSGKPYAKHAGFCLETQHFPDSPNRPSYPSTELKPGQILRSSTVYTFGVAP